MLDDLVRLGRSLTLVQAGDLNDAGDDLVRILMTLASDVERFDSMVVVQRRLLEERSTHSDADDDERLARRSDQLSREAAEIVTHARQALEQLRHLSVATKQRSS